MRRMFVLTLLAAGLAVAGAFWAQARTTIPCPADDNYTLPPFFPAELPANCREHALLKRREFARQDAAQIKREVVLAGDSLVEAWAPLPLAGRIQLANRGIAGDSTNGLHERLLRDVVALQPRVAVVLIGVNDLYLFGSMYRPDRARHAAANIVSLAQRLVGHGIRPLVVSLLPVRTAITAESTELSNELIRAVNAELARELPRTGAVWLDAYDPLSDEKKWLREEYSQGGLHLTPAGYAALNALVEPALDKMLR